MTEVTGDILAWVMAGVLTIIGIALVIWGFALGEVSGRETPSMEEKE